MNGVPSHFLLLFFFPSVRPLDGDADGAGDPACNEIVVTAPPDHSPVYKYTEGKHRDGLAVNDTYRVVRKKTSPPTPFFDILASFYYYSAHFLAVPTTAATHPQPRHTHTTTHTRTTTATRARCTVDSVVYSTVMPVRC